MPKCDYCYKYFDDLKYLNNIRYPRSYEKSEGNFCQKCYKNKSYNGPLCRNVYSDIQIDEIKKSVKDRKNFLLDI